MEKKKISLYNRQKKKKKLCYYKIEDAPMISFHNFFFFEFSIFFFDLKLECMQIVKL